MFIDITSPLVYLGSDVKNVKRLKDLNLRLDSILWVRVERFQKNAKSSLCLKFNWKSRILCSQRVL